MNEFTKRLLSFATAAVMVFSMIPNVGFAADNDQGAESQAQSETSAYEGELNLVDGKAVCPVCKGDAVEWTPLEAGQGLKKGVHYYLADSIEDTATANGSLFSSAWTSGFDNNDGTICLHLNGKNVTTSGKYAFTMSTYGGTMNIMGTGTVSSTNWYGAVYLNNANAIFNIYSGTFVKGDATGNQPVIRVQTAGASVNMHGGQIGTEGNTMQHGTAAAVYLNAGSFTLNDGTIYGGTGNSAGSVYVAKDATLTVNGGKITGGKAGATNCDVYVVSGGTLTNNTYIDAIDAVNLADASGKLTGKCRYCDDGEVKTWSKRTSNYHTAGHYYMPVSGVTQATSHAIALTGAANSPNCFNLNGANVTASAGRAIRLTTGVMNIMGTGTVTGQGSVATNDSYTAIDVSGGATLNIYGGTFTQSDTVASLAKISSSGTINIFGGKLENTAEVASSVPLIYINAGANGKLTVGADAVLDAKNDYAFNCWTSTGEVSLSGRITGKIKMQSALGKLVGEPEISWLVPDSPVDATGMTGGSVAVDKVGVFTTAFENPEAAAAAVEYFSVYNGDGSKEVFANADKKLEIGAKRGGVNDPLVLDGTTGWCPVCKAYKTWTPLSGNSSTQVVPASDKDHYYLSGTYTNTTTTSGGAFYVKNANTCLHLNGFEYNYTPASNTQGALYASSGKTLNLMGTGLISSSINANYYGAALYASGATVNVYGDMTFTKASAATASPIIHIDDSQLNLIGNATIGQEGLIYNYTSNGHFSAAITLRDAGVVNMQNGTVYGGDNTFTSSGNATSYGTAVAWYNAGGTFNMTGGEIKADTTATGTNDALIYMNSAGTLKIGDNAQVGAANGLSIRTSNAATDVTIAGTVTGTVDLSLSNASRSVTLTGTPAIGSLILPANSNITATGMTGLKDGSAPIVLNTTGTVGTFTDAEAARAWFALADSLTGYNLKVSGDTLVVEEDLPAPGTITGELTVTASGKGYCPVCEAYHTWTEWAGGGITEGGHYYLTGDLTAATTITATDAVCLHLNDNDITVADAAAISVTGAATLNIMGTGTISGAGTAKNTGAALHVTKGQVNLYSGNYTKSDTVAPIIYASGGNVTMAVKEGDAATGAVIGSATGLSATTAAVYLGASTFTMNNGTIYGLTASADAGAVYLGSGANFVMNDGEVLLGSCATSRTLILAAYGSATIGEGAEVDATEAGFALNQWNAGSSVVTISGTITGKVNTSHANGGLKLVGTPTLTYLYVGTSNNTTPPTVGLIDVNGLEAGATIKVFADTPCFTTAITGNINTIKECFQPYTNGYEIAIEGNTLEVRIPKGEINGELNLVGSRGWCHHCNEYVTWTKITAAGNLTNGHYYLANDIETDGNGLKTGWYDGIDYSKAAKICLHLNGNDIISSGGSAIMMSRNYGAELSIMGRGTVSGVGSGSYPAYTGAAIQMNHHLGVINLYSGTYTKPETDVVAPVIFVQDGGGTINMYDDAVIDAAGRSATSLSPAVALYGGGQSLTVANVSFVDDNGGYSAGENPARPGVFNMYGGIIKTGTAGSHGNGVSLIKKYTQFNMYGGQINEEDTTKTDNVIVIAHGKVNITTGVETIAKVYGTINQWSNADAELAVSGAVNKVSASNKTAGIVLSGTPAIGELNLASGVLIDVSEMEGVANGSINLSETTTGVITGDLTPEKSNALVGCFVATRGGYEVTNDNPGNELSVIFTITTTENIVWTDEANHVGYCPVCKVEVTWTPITQANVATSTFVMGSSQERNEDKHHYYLTEDLTGANGVVSTSWTVSESVCLHLNGHNITSTSTAQPAVKHMYDGTLNVMGTGVITGKNGNNHTLSGSATKYYHGAALWVTVGNTNGAGVVNIYGGTWTKSTDNTTSPIIAITDYTGTDPNRGGGEINMYAGTIGEKDANATLPTGDTAVAVIATLGNAAFNMHGGEIWGIDSTSSCVRVGSAKNSFNMYGGTVQSNRQAVGTTYVNMILVENGSVVIGKDAVLDGSGNYRRAVNTWGSKTANITVSGTVKGMLLSQSIAPTGVILVGEPKIDTLRITNLGYVNVDEMTGGEITNLDITSNNNVYLGIFTTASTNPNLTEIAGCFSHIGGNVYQIVVNGTALEVVKASYVVCDADGTEVQVSGVEDAIAYVTNPENEGSYIKITDITGFTLNGETIRVDMNGNDATISGSGYVIGFDSTTDNFGVVNAGILSTGGTVEVRQDQYRTVKENGKDVAYRYLYIMHGEGKYSFHRLQMKLTNVVLNTQKAALYYKAVFQTDAALAARVEDFGISYGLVEKDGEGNITAGGMPNIKEPLNTQLDVSMMGAAGSFTGNNDAKTSYICDIVSEGENNTTAVETQICANPYIFVDVTGNADVEGFGQYAPNATSSKSMKDILDYYDNEARYEALKNQTFTDAEDKPTNKALELDAFCEKMNLTGFTYIGKATAALEPAATNDEEEEA